MGDHPTILASELQPSVATTARLEVFDRVAGETLAESVTLPVLEEQLSIGKRQVVKGLVRVSTRTETVEQVADAVLDRSMVDITRVPVERFVEAAPPDRIEGDTTIVSVVEERLVLVKQLVVTEELHIRRRVEQETVHTVVPLRRQTAAIERLDADGRAKN